MARSILAVIAGAAVWALLWIGGTSGLAALFPDLTRPDERLTHVGIMITLIVYSVLLSVLAGWTTGRLSRADAVRDATILAAIQLVLGIGFQASAWSLFPIWYHVVFLGLIVPATVYGGRLAARRQPFARQAAAHG